MLRSLALSSLALTLVLAQGCNGSSNPSGTSPSKSTGSSTTNPTATTSPQASPAPSASPATTPAAVSRFLYAANAGSDEIDQLAIDPATGALSSAGTPVSTGAGSSPFAVATDSTGRFLFATLSGSSASSVAAFVIEPGTGVLGPAQVAPLVAPHTGPQFCAVDGTGKFLLVTDLTNALLAFPIDQTSGALGTPTSVDAGGVPVALAERGGFVYVARVVINLNAGTSASDVAVFALDAAGKLTAVTQATPASLGDQPSGLALDPAGARVFACGNGWIQTFSRDAATGALAAAGTRTTVASTVVGLATDPAGTHLFASCQTPDQVASFSIDPTTGALAAVGKPSTAGPVPGTIALDATGTFGFTPDLMGGVSIFKLDASGSLVAAGSFPLGANGLGPQTVVAGH